MTWTILRRGMLKPGVGFDLPRHLYLRDIYRCRANELVIYKASQMGASEYAISYSLHAADVRKATVLYVFPTDTHVSDFSAARIGPAIEASPYLGSIVVEGGVRGGDKRGADRVTLKRIGDRFLYLRGAQVDKDGRAPQLKSIDADVLVLDEVDEMDPRAPAIALKRLGHSQIAEVRWISTPSYPDFGIHAAWKESDQREWHVRCDACGERQPLTIDLVVKEWDDVGRPKRWNGMEGVVPPGDGGIGSAPGQVYASCRRCDKPLDRLGSGEWVATYPERSERAGFHVTKLFSAAVDLGEIIQNLQTTDETRRKEAYNQDLGEPYLPRGGKLGEAELDACRREYAMGVVKDEHTVLGADVGKLIHVVVRGSVQPETGERPLRYAGEVESFEALGRLIQQYHVGRAVIDALPETRKARELQADFPKGKVWLAYYVQQKTGTKRESEAAWDDREGVVNVDRTRTLDMTFARFYDQVNTLPADIRGVREYYAHLQAPVRVLEEGTGGQKVAVYVAAQPDHYSHAENYCTVASLAEGTPGAAIAEAETGQYHSGRRKSAWQ